MLRFILRVLYKRSVVGWLRGLHLYPGHHSLTMTIKQETFSAHKSELSIAAVPHMAH